MVENFWCKKIVNNPFCLFKDTINPLGKFFVVLCLVLPAGCVNYIGINSNKKIAPPAVFQTEKSLPKQQGKWPNNNWASQFGDPQLVFLIREALANNPSLQVARARVAQARALAGGRQAKLFPALNSFSAINRLKLPDNGTITPLLGSDWVTPTAFLGYINYELDIWGKNLSSFRQAISQERASEASEQEARLSLAASVASTYNQLAYYYALRDVLKRTVYQRGTLAKIAQVRLKTGVDTKVQVFQSQNTIASARTQLVEVEGQILLTRQQLGTLLGGGPDRGLSITIPVLKSLNTPALPADLPMNLLGRRPDIVAARWQVEASCQGIDNVKAQFYPDVNLLASAGFLSFGLDHFFSKNNTEYLIGPAVTLPLFDAGALRAKLRGEYAKYEESVANYNVTLSNALADVVTQITTIQSIDRQLQAQKEAYDSAQRAYALSKHQYDIGLTSQLVVLDAETSYLNEQQTRLQLISNRRNLQIALIKSLGGGFGTRKLVIVKKTVKCCTKEIKPARG